MIGPTRTTPYIHVGRKLYLRKPRDLSPRLLGLALESNIARYGSVVKPNDKRLDKGLDEGLGKEFSS